MGSTIDMFISVLPALMLVIGGPLLLWWWTKRNRTASTHRLRITDKAALGRNTWVAILEVDDVGFNIVDSAVFSVSDTGTLVYLPGSGSIVESQLVAADLEGRPAPAHQKAVPCVASLKLSPQPP